MARRWSAPRGASWRAGNTSPLGAASASRAASYASTRARRLPVEAGRDRRGQITALMPSRGRCASGGAPAPPRRSWRPAPRWCCRDHARRSTRERPAARAPRRPCRRRRRVNRGSNLRRARGARRCSRRSIGSHRAAAPRAPPATRSDRRRFERARSVSSNVAISDAARAAERSALNASTGASAAAVSRSDADACEPARHLGDGGRAPRPKATSKRPAGRWARRRTAHPRAPRSDDLRVRQLGA